MPVKPRDAAAIILLKNPHDPEVFWVKRNAKLMFMGGFHAFPGGQTDPSDMKVQVQGYTGEAAAMRACAVREFFEETGVLLARGATEVVDGRLDGLRSKLARGETNLLDILEEFALEIEGNRLVDAGRWVTPPFAPRRFDTWFFLSWLPEGQEPRIEDGELESGEWIRPGEALERWTRGEIMLAPPTLFAIRTLAEFASTPERFPQALTDIPEARAARVRRIESRPGIFLFPVRTPTLPPATHTNCYIVGGREVVVVDPASPYREEQEDLAAFIDELISEGRSVREILLTHHHPDHVGGVNHLREHLGVPVAAHELTAERLKGIVRVDRLIKDNDLIYIEGTPGWRLRALHTPGHTRGHLCFYEEITGAILTGDLVVGLGTVLIAPPEGNMRQYFNSLRRLLSLPKLSSLFGAHGPAIGSAQHKLEEYLEHRTMRENRILDAIRSGASNTAAVVRLAYDDVSSDLNWLAEQSTTAHVEKLMAEGRVGVDGEGRWTVA